MSHLDYKKKSIVKRTRLGNRIDTTECMMGRCDDAVSTCILCEERRDENEVHS